MPGFPFAAIGAGLGQFAQQYQQQQAQRERQQMLMLTLAKFAQEQKDRQEERSSANQLWGAGGVTPVGQPPQSGGFPGAVSAPETYIGGLRGPGGGATPAWKEPAASSPSNAGDSWLNQNAPFPTRANPNPPAPRFTMNEPPASAYAEVSGPGAPTGGPSGGSPTDIPPPRDGGGPNAPRETQMADASGAQAPAQSSSPIEIPDLRKRLNAIIPPDVNGRMSEAALKAKIDQACPTCPAVYKLKYLDAELKRLAPMEAERVRAAHDRYKTQIDAETRMWEAQVRQGERAETGGTIVERGDATYRIKGNVAEPVTIAGTKEPLTDARKLAGGGATTASAGREKDVVTEIKRLDDAYVAAHPEATKAERDSAHFENRKAAEKGLTAAKTSEGRTPAAMHMRKYLEQHPDASPQDISRASAGFVRDQSIERNFAGGSGATQMRSLNTVADHLSLMRGYAEALQTGDIPRVNQLQQILSKETGWPEVTNFNVARDIMADEVVRLLTSTGGTEADRAGMQSRFAAAMSPDQMHGALEAAERFVAGRFKGLEQNYARNDPARRREFEQEMLTPEARGMFTKYGQQSSGTPAAPSPATPAQPAQAAPVGPQEGQTATNPQTGAKLIYRGGQWTPVQ